MSPTVTAFKAEIDLAVTNKTGLQMVLHPKVVGTTDRTTLAGFVEVLAYLDAKRTAEDLLVLSPYELMLADAT